MDSFLLNGSTWNFSGMKRVPDEQTKKNLPLKGVLLCIYCVLIMFFVVMTLEIKLSSVSTVDAYAYRRFSSKVFEWFNILSCERFLKESCLL